MQEFEYEEEDFLHLAGIQHFLFCRRQWALIHVEQQWNENVFTVEGDLLHAKAHDGFSSETRKNIIISRGMPIRSREMGVSGICDIVEFVKSDNGISIYGKKDKYILYPVEYKRGKPKISDEDRMQLTAQVICLEEMFLTNISSAYLYYGEIRRRELVDINDNLKEKCRKIFKEMHQYYINGYTPSVKKSKKCISCSLSEFCVSEIDQKDSVKKYIKTKISRDINY